MITSDEARTLNKERCDVLTIPCFTVLVRRVASFGWVISLLLRRRPDGVSVWISRSWVQTPGASDVQSGASTELRSEQRREGSKWEGTPLPKHTSAVARMGGDPLPKHTSAVSQSSFAS